MIKDIPSFMKEVEEYPTFSDFKKDVAFVDIETTGLSKYHNEITLFGIYHSNHRPNVYINGINLSDAKGEFQRHKYIITFNGNGFDLPFIHHHIKVSKQYISIDLMVLFHRLNMYGGLKAIERNLGIIRDESVLGVTGRDAVVLWRKYKNGDEKSLDTLVKYNREDILNLEILLNYLYHKSLGAGVDIKCIENWRKKIYANSNLTLKN